MKNKNSMGAILPKLLMGIGAVWIMIYAVAIAIKKENVGIMYGLQITWPLLLLLGLTYILIPFSVKVGMWSLIWAILIGAISVLLLIGSLTKVDYKSAWTYLGAAPYAFLALGSVLWALTSFKGK